MKKPNILALNPAAILFAVNALIALAIAWGAHWNADTTGIVDGVITTVIALITAIMTRPVVSLQLIVGGVTGVITALAPFGLHLTADQLSTGAVALSLVLAGIFHLAHVPYVADKQGTTAHELQGVRSATRAV
jgi:formate hydrogenlyase subunit 3/multisubunit Na+/H+ antiporter MnhD subunit